MGAKTKIEWTDTTWTPIRARVRTDAREIAKQKSYTSLLGNFRNGKAIIVPGRVGPHCEVVSAGCEHCYSATNNARCLPNNGTGLPFDRRSRDLVEMFVDENILMQPMQWKAAKRIFVCSQTDLFGDWVTDAMIDRVMLVMMFSRFRAHTFQVLTKRAERMRDYMSSKATRERICAMGAAIAATTPGVNFSVRHIEDGFEGVRLDNVWLGVSVENQEQADKRIPLLLQTPAAVRWVSAEPLLGPVDLTSLDNRQTTLQTLDRMIAQWSERGDAEKVSVLTNVKASIPLGKMPKGECPRVNALNGEWFDGWDIGIDAGAVINWVVVGGESGAGARPMHPDWALSLRDQCTAAKVPFLFKQWGAWAAEMRPGTEVLLGTLKMNQKVGYGDGETNHTVYTRVGKKIAGRMLDGREWNEYPEVRNA